MRLNLLIGSMGPPGPEPEEPKCQNPDVRPRAGSKTLGDPRPKLSATRAIKGSESSEGYWVNGESPERVMRTPRETANPDVSGFVSRACRSGFRESGAGDESLAGARTERAVGSRERTRR